MKRFRWVVCLVGCLVVFVFGLLRGSFLFALASVLLVFLFSFVLVFVLRVAPGGENDVR